MAIPADGGRAILQRPIVAIFPRGEAIRNFAYGSVLRTLQARQGCAVLSVKPNADVWEVLSGQCTNLEPLEEFEERYPVRILRDLLDMAHGRWLWSEAARERWRRRDLEAVTPGQKLKRWGRKVAAVPFAGRRGLALLSRTERMASRAFSPTGRYTDLYHAWKPSLVFNASHVHSRNAIQAVQSAQWLGIPTATFIFSWDNLTSQGRVLPPYDFYLVWNDALKHQLLDIYPEVRADRVFVTGTPQFDAHFDTELVWSRDALCRRIGATPGRPLILYATGMANHMPQEEQIVEGIADMLKDMTHLGAPQLVVRVYAKDRTGRFDALRARRPDILFPEARWEPNWLTPLPDDVPLWSNLLRHADAGINVASTVSLELCMFDKPVINVGYNPPGVSRDHIDYARYYRFDHYSPVVASGAVRVAADAVEMQRLIEAALTTPGADTTSRRQLLQQMFGQTLDGQSGARAADVLLELAR